MASEKDLNMKKKAQKPSNSLRLEYFCHKIIYTDICVQTFIYYPTYIVCTKCL